MFETIEQEPFWPGEVVEALANQLRGLDLRSDRIDRERARAESVSTIQSEEQLRFDLRGAPWCWARPNAYRHPMRHIEWLLKRDTDVRHAYITSSGVSHIFSCFEREQFCGYRCMQMIVSALIDFARAGSRTTSRRQRFKTIPDFNGYNVQGEPVYRPLTTCDKCQGLFYDCTCGHKTDARKIRQALRCEDVYVSSEFRRWIHQDASKFPTITDIQARIHQAWSENIRQECHLSTGGVFGTRRWVGAIEAQALFRSLQLKCQLHKFPGRRCQESRVDSNAWEKMLEKVIDYFCENDAFSFTSSTKPRIKKVEKPPLYLQIPGHALLVVGIELRQPNGSSEISSASRRTTSIQKKLREGIRWVKNMKGATQNKPPSILSASSDDSGIANSDEWSLLVLDPGSNGTDYQTRHLRRARRLQANLDASHSTARRDKYRRKLSTEAKRLLMSFRKNGSRTEVLDSELADLNNKIAT